MRERLEQRHADRQQNAQGDRHVHVERAHPQGRQGGAEEGLAGIGDRRQRDQRGKHVEQVAGFGRDVRDVAGPDRNRKQHDVGGGEPGHGERAQQGAPLRVGSGLELAGVERVGLEAETRYRGDDRFGALGPVAPFHRHARAGQVDAGLGNTLESGNAALQLGHAAGAAHPLHGEVHVGMAIVEANDETVELAGSRELGLCRADGHGVQTGRFSRG